MIYTLRYLGVPLEENSCRFRQCGNCCMPLCLLHIDSPSKLVKNK